MELAPVTQIWGGVWVDDGRQNTRKMLQDSHGIWTGKSLLYLASKSASLILLQKLVPLACLLFRGLHSGGLLGYTMTSHRIQSSGAWMPEFIQSKTRRLQQIWVIKLKDSDAPLILAFNLPHRDSAEIRASHALSQRVKQKQKNRAERRSTESDEATPPSMPLPAKAKGMTSKISVLGPRQRILQH